MAWRTVSRVPPALAVAHNARMHVDYRLEVEDTDLMVTELGIAPGSRKQLLLLLVRMPRT